jgi:hypothetical protein
MRTVHTALEQAADMMRRGQPEAAGEALQTCLRQVRPKTPGLDKVHNAIAAAERTAIELHVAARAREFHLALLRKDWDACVEFVHPDSRQQLGVKGLRGRLQLLGFFGGVLAITENDIEVTDIALADDLQSAVVMQRVRVKGRWGEENQQKWRRADAGWCLLVEQ